MKPSKKPAKLNSDAQQPGPEKENRSEIPLTEEELLFRTLKQFADALVATFPRMFEVVVHDLSQPQKSIRHIAGDITRRKSGGPVTDLLVKALHQEGRAIRDRYNYKTTTSDGRVLKSTTIFIRDSKGNVAFALCINFDMTDFLNTSYALEIFTSVAGAFNDQEKVETFAMSITETFQALFNQAVAKIGKQPVSMSMEEKIDLVRELETLGVFNIKGGTDQAALLMGVSKYTIYNYIKKYHAVDGVNRF